MHYELKKILSNYAKEFHIQEIHGIQFLEKCKQTALTRTLVPNSLCYADKRNYLLQALDNPNIEAIISPKKILFNDQNNTKCIIVSEKPEELFYFIHNKVLSNLSLKMFEPEIHPTAKIADSAIIKKNAKIGKNVIIHDGCVILDNTIIQDNSIIYENVTIGTQGNLPKIILGEKQHVQHLGGVKIGSNCIIHAGSNVSRSVNFNEYTSIGNNTHLGIQTNIGHDVKIGNDCNISGKVCIAGRVILKDKVWVGAGVTISNTIKVGENVQIKIGAVVINNIEDNEIVSGNFAFRHSCNLRNFLKRLTSYEQI